MPSSYDSMLLTQEQFKSRRHIINLLCALRELSWFVWRTWSFCGEYAEEREILCFEGNHEYHERHPWLRWGREFLESIFFRICDIWRSTSSWKRIWAQSIHDKLLLVALYCWTNQRSLSQCMLKVARLKDTPERTQEASSPVPKLFWRMRTLTTISWKTSMTTALQWKAKFWYGKFVEKRRFRGELSWYDHLSEAFERSRQEKSGSNEMQFPLNEECLSAFLSADIHYEPQE